ncbi:AraC family transcriptional regulator [Vallitalea pronyensis]|uniref:AraC family transcriptional regulator n=1 Tax=Vallitalea pronyensis TaxID=1348613 RepID=A0A8J8MPV3_9FIRM|nr:AraC family transcriptional regulator [Vallitalea pronyensis]QUI25414.1 AraC family transcriptional regulator [Vallitalea pronyensis]
MLTINRRLSYYKRNLISYIFLFFLPVLIFIVLYQFLFNTILKEELIRNSQSQLTSLEKNISSEMNQIDAVVNQVNIGTQFAPFTYIENPNYAKDRINQLRRYTAVNPFIHNILLHYNDDKYVYASSGSFVLDYTFDNVFIFENYSTRELIETMENPGTGITASGITLNLYGETIPTHCSIVVRGLTYSGYGHYGSLAFFVDEKSIMSQIQTTFQSDIYANYILDSNNQLITHVIPEFSKSDTTYRALIESHDQVAPSTIHKINGDDYLMTYTTSETTGWQYYCFTPVDEALAVAIHTQRRFLIIVICLLLFGLLAISIFMTLNYSPIKKLQTLSKDFIDGNTNPNGSELKDIEGAILSLSSQNVALNEALDDNFIAAKAYLIGQLISGQPMVREHLDRSLLMKIMNPQITDYAIVMAHIGQDEQDDWHFIKNDLMHDIEEKSGTYLQLLCTENNIRYTITILILLQEGFKENVLDELHQIHKNLNEKWQRDITFGLGSLTDNLSNLPRSYMGASTAIDYRLMIGNGSLIQYDNLVDNIEQASTYPYAELEQFKLAIRRGFPKDVDNALNNIVAQIQTKNIPIFIGRSICYEIISTVVHSYESLGQNHDELFNKYPDIIAITKYESIHKIIELVTLISYDVCSALSKSSTKEHIRYVDSLKQYISVNYSSPDFSLQLMADHFHKQASNLSSFYKENTGENILESVTRYRMNAASNYLINSTLPIKEICTEIGYTNVSSFIRRFKQFHELTPGQYRELYQDIT